MRSPLSARTEPSALRVCYPPLRVPNAIQMLCYSARPPYCSRVLPSALRACRQARIEEKRRGAAEVAERMAQQQQGKAAQTSGETGWRDEHESSRLSLSATLNYNAFSSH